MALCTPNAYLYLAWSENSLEKRGARVPLVRSTYTGGITTPRNLNIEPECLLKSNTLWVTPGARQPIFLFEETQFNIN